MKQEIKRDWINIDEIIETEKKNRLFERFQELGLVKKLEQPKKLKSGKYSYWFFDLKLAYSDKESLCLIAELLVSEIPKETTCITLDEGSHELGGLLSVKTGLPICYLRPSNIDPNKPMYKGYTPVENDKICFIDDVYTEGSAFFDSNVLIYQLFSTFTSSLIVILDRGDLYLEATEHASILYGPDYVPELLTENTIKI